MRVCVYYAIRPHRLPLKKIVKREARHKKILALIQAKPIATQEELRTLLEHAGVPATQSSVSRDLDELGVVKHHGHYTLPRANGAAARGLLSLDVAGDSLVVAKTEPGLASAVAVQIDAAAIPEIVGTLAGEDTIFVAVNDRKAQRTAINRIWKLLKSVPPAVAGG
jgi:transcriptional regulator of arginine metabolism